MAHPLLKCLIKSMVVYCLLVNFGSGSNLRNMCPILRSLCSTMEKTFHLQSYHRLHCKVHRAFLDIELKLFLKMVKQLYVWDKKQIFLFWEIVKIPLKPQALPPYISSSFLLGKSSKHHFRMTSGKTANIFLYKKLLAPS